MAGYICFYNRERHEVHADSSLKAQEAAREHFQKKFPRRKVKGYDIAVVIAENDDGKPVVHSTGSL